ncbi:hypothetical protein MTO96_033144, partial [Rhipicephalus appendiculatus]
MLFCVDLGEEGEYFADVGFGGPTPFKALPAEGEAAPYRTRRLDAEGNVEVAIRSGSDFVPTYWYASLNPRSLFRNTLMVGRFVDDSWLTLVDGRYCRRFMSGKVEQRIIADVDEVIHLLDVEFALKINPDMDLDFFKARI